VTWTAEDQEVAEAYRVLAEGARRRQRFRAIEAEPWVANHWQPGMTGADVTASVFAAAQRQRVAAECQRLGLGAPDATTLSELHRRHCHPGAERIRLRLWRLEQKRTSAGLDKRLAALGY
jgi:hypothetical protein